MKSETKSIKYGPTSGRAVSRTHLQLSNSLLICCFIRRLDEIQLNKESQARLVGINIKDPVYTDEQSELRWSNFRNLDPESMYHMFTKANGVFDFMKNVGAKDSVFASLMKGATFMIPTPRLLDMVVQQIDKVQMSDRDTKGDLYEYLLSKIATSGTNGQFRTPRHIIKTPCSTGLNSILPCSVLQP